MARVWVPFLGHWLDNPDQMTYVWLMKDDPMPQSTPTGWRESLARSKAQIAAGETVPLLPILDRLRASAERLEADQGVTADGVKISDTP